MKPITEYIPQRQPFVAVTNLLHCDSIVTKTSFQITKDCLFVDNNKLSEFGLIENIAQTCAVRLGYLNENQPVKIGMIGSIDNFELFELPKINNEITTIITVTTEVANIVVLSAVSYFKDIILAKCNMKVVLT